MNSLYYSDNSDRQQLGERHSVAVGAEATGFAGQINQIGATNGLIVSEDGSPEGRPDHVHHELQHVDTFLSRIVGRFSRTTWFCLMRRVFRYQNGREGSDLRSNPLNTGTWICLEFALILAQIISVTVILLISRAEKPISPLRLWVVGYAFGCCLSLPLLYWRYKHPYNDSGDRPNAGRPISNSHVNSLRMRYGRSGRIESGPSPHGGYLNGDSRITLFMERCRMSLDFFFAVWFVIGNVWVFGTRRTFSDDAPALYRLCIVLLALSCVGYALPFILFAVLCCCMPCISSFLGYNVSIQEKEKGASSEAIAALPTHKFKSMFEVEGKFEKVESDDEDSVNGGGYIVDTIGKKRILLAEDAECCICLTKYKDNEYLKELPCVHLFHVGCVDQWLKINSTCPLCKRELSGASNASDHAVTSSRPRYEHEEMDRQVIDI